MGDIVVNGSSLGNSLQDLLMAGDLEPGDAPSYQLCKQIYSFHPLGRKMAESPIGLAQSQSRQITVADSPEDMVRDAFVREWTAVGADRLIANVMTVARIYGIASVCLLVDGVAADKPVNYAKLYDSKISFNVLDPLNTAGSLVLDQNPNAMDFQKHAAITISGTQYHRSRSCTVLNEEPLYIDYTTSAFGFVGRSVYQRALFPLKSFVQTMLTDDLIAVKSGVIIAKVKQPGSIVNNLMQMAAGIKRQFVQEARVGSVISIQPEEFIESLNLQNLEGPFALARSDILKTIATAADMPAVMLENETLTEGFGEGTEDAKAIARYVDRIRIQMAPLYAYFDKIVQHRAWNPDFYKYVQAQYPEVYGDMKLEEAFYRWQNSFAAEWPNLLTEPDSEKIKTEDVVFKAAIAAAEVFLPAVDPQSKVEILQWLADTLNSRKLLFPEPLVLDTTRLLEWTEEQAEKMDDLQSAGGGPEDQEPKPGTRTYEHADDAMSQYDRAVAHLPLRPARRKQARGE